jgi:hypothetical protein
VKETALNAHRCWTVPAFDATDQKRYGIKMPDTVPMTVTDRAYTSPIWYTPAN